LLCKDSNRDSSFVQSAVGSSLYKLNHPRQHSSLLGRSSCRHHQSSSPWKVSLKFFLL